MGHLSAGPPDVSASVKAYFTLKLLGDRADAAHMTRARATILGLGVSTPAIRSPRSTSRSSASTTGTSVHRSAGAGAVPALVLREPVRDVVLVQGHSRAAEHHQRAPAELPGAGSGRHPGARRRGLPGPAPTLWSAAFHGLDAWIKLVEKLPRGPARQLALERAERWILERLEDSDGLGAIFPPIVNTIIALHAQGYPFEHPVLSRQVRELERLEIETADTLRVQPCFSPVWDTALAVNALIESGVPAGHAGVARAAGWLLERRGHGAGDWRVKNERAEHSGWYFEYANPFYPDCDTTSQVITSLSKVAPAGRRALRARARGDLRGPLLASDHAEP